MAMRAARPFAAVMLIMDFHTTTEEINRQRRAGRRLKVWVYVISFSMSSLYCHDNCSM